MFVGQVDYDKRAVLPANRFRLFFRALSHPRPGAAPESETSVKTLWHFCLRTLCQVALLLSPTILHCCAEPLWSCSFKRIRRQSSGGGGVLMVITFSAGCCKLGNSWSHSLVSIAMLAVFHRSSSMYCVSAYKSGWCFGFIVFMQMKLDLQYISLFLLK